MDDKEILILYNSGEREQAFNLLMRTYSERLYWLIRNIVHTHEDTDDLLQDTWVKVWNALDTFREDAKLYTWLYRIATNEALTFLRKQKLKSFVTFVDYDCALAAKIDEETHFDGDKLQLELQKAVATLPPKQKAVFALRYWEEMPYEEMAEVLDSTPGSLKTSYHFAYEKVKEILKREIDF